MNYEKHLNLLLSSEQVSLTELLDQKEQRAARQQAMLSDGGSLISYTMNIAGPNKRAPVLRAAFEEGCRLIYKQLAFHGIAVRRQERTDLPGGEELYVLTDAPADAVKALTVQIEDSCLMGRLWDIDVMDEKGIRTRRALGYPPRRCLICDEPAVVCARGRAHRREAVVSKTVRIICDHFNGQFADETAALCCRALLYEAAVTPKPGLVDRLSCGAHRDMDCFTFLASAPALMPYFRQCVLLGMQNLPPKRMFATLRYPGRLAEDAMLRATGGINTHKGAIFSMGILAAAVGCLHDREKPFTAFDVFALTRQMCDGLIEGDLGAGEGTGSNGEQLFRRYGVQGARGEAAAGFPSVADIGLPKLKAYLAQGLTPNDAGMLTLLHLMAQVEDTNIIHRSSPETAAALREKTGALLARGDVTAADMETLDAELTADNLSPGGCADLLALSFFIHFAEDTLMQ